MTFSPASTIADRLIDSCAAEEMIIRWGFSWAHDDTNFAKIIKELIKFAEASIASATEELRKERDGTLAKREEALFFAEQHCTTLEAQVEQLRDALGGLVALDKSLCGRHRIRPVASALGRDRQMRDRPLHHPRSFSPAERWDAMSELMINDFGRVEKPRGDCSLHRDGFHHCTMNCSGAVFMPRVETHFIYPPITLRQFDWCAYYEGVEPDDDGNMEAGYGKTEHDAIIDLLENYPDPPAAPQETKG